MSMLKVRFTRNCRATREGFPAPYFALPPPTSEAGKRFYSQQKGKEREIIAHMVPTNAVSQAAAATHFVYEFNGGHRARVIDETAAYTVAAEEVDALEYRYPGLIERLPDVATVDATVSVLLEEKRQLKAVTENKQAEIDKVRGALSDTEIELERVKGELRAAQAALEKPSDRADPVKVGASRPQQKSK